MEVEVALTFLYMLGEALPASHGNHFSGDPVIFLYRYISVQLYSHYYYFWIVIDKSFCSTALDGVARILWR